MKIISQLVFLFILHILIFSDGSTLNNVNSLFFTMGTFDSGKSHASPDVLKVGRISNQISVSNQLLSEKCIILSEQSQNRIVVVSTASGNIIWEWKAETSNIKPANLKWFNAPSDAKIVYNGLYMLISASGGGVALVRIKDKKTVFYAFAGGNTHSIELLPDGNIVSTSSTGNFITIFRTDTINSTEEIYRKKIQIKFGHSIVWDNKRQLLWATAMDHLVAFKYNFNCIYPDLIRIDSVVIPGT